MLQDLANKKAGHYIETSSEVKAIITKAIDGEVSKYSHALSDESRVEIANTLYRLISSRVGRNVASQETVA